MVNRNAFTECGDFGISIIKLIDLFTEHFLHLIPATFVDLIESVSPHPNFLSRLALSLFLPPLFVFVFFRISDVL